MVRPLYSDPQNPGFLHRRHARCHFFLWVSFLTIGLLKRYKNRRRVVGTCIANDAMLRWSAQLFLVTENDHFEGGVDLKMDLRKYRMEHRNVGWGAFFPNKDPYDFSSSDRRRLQSARSPRLGRIEWTAGTLYNYYYTAP